MSHSRTLPLTQQPRHHAHNRLEHTTHCCTSVTQASRPPLMTTQGSQGQTDEWREAQLTSESTNPSLLQFNRWPPRGVCCLTMGAECGRRDATASRGVRRSYSISAPEAAPATISGAWRDTPNLATDVGGRPAGAPFSSTATWGWQGSQACERV